MKNKFRYYIYDFLIGQHLLTIDIEDKKIRIDCFNIYGQCSTLDRDWTKVSNRLINRALNFSGYSIDPYILEHFTKNKGYNNDKKLLFQSNDYDECILFLASYGIKNHNYMDNQNHEYLKKYLKDKEKKLDDFIVRMNKSTTQDSTKKTQEFKEIEDELEQDF